MPEAINKNNDTPLRIAVQSGHNDIVQLLKNKVAGLVIDRDSA